MRGATSSGSCEVRPPRVPARWTSRKNLIRILSPSAMIVAMQIIGEYYHIYNRGAHRAPIFHDKSDYERFIGLLYIANGTKPIKYGWNDSALWQDRSDDKIVEIFAYCLMPNHFHIGAKETKEGGINKFIRKLITGYTMYYNFKYKHSGTIFQGNYKYKHVDNDPYLRYLIRYIHLNPYGLEEEALNDFARLDQLKEAIEYSKGYEYSSYKDYLGIKRPQNLIIETID